MPVVAVAMVLVWSLSTAPVASAQDSPAPAAVAEPPGGFFLPDPPDNFLDFGFWYTISDINFGKAASSATDEVKGYTAVLPTQMEGSGGGFGFVFSWWGFAIDFTEASASIGQPADLTGDTVADVTVESVERTDWTFSLLWQPVRWLSFGYGADSGAMKFTQINGGVRETNTLYYAQPFYSLAFAVGFDPEISDTSLNFEGFVRFPAEATDFNATKAGFSLGFFF